MAFNAVPFTQPGGQLLLPLNERLLMQHKADFRLSAGGKDVVPASSGGTVYATTARVIFKPAKPTPEFTSVMIPVYFCSKQSLQQPLFGANYFQCDVAPFENSRMSSTAQLRLTFPDGGAYDFFALFEKVHAAILQAAANAPPPPDPRDPSLPAYDEVVGAPPSSLAASQAPPGFGQNGPAYPMQMSAPTFAATSNFPAT